MKTAAISSENSKSALRMTVILAGLLLALSSFSALVPSSFAAGSSQLTVKTVAHGGGALTGYYVALMQQGNVIASGFTPATFTVTNGVNYQVEVSGYGNYYFQYWAGSRSVNPVKNFKTSTSRSLTAVLCNGPPGTCSEPTPKNGITVYAHRIPASYWAPCFAVACSAGTGPGASMYFALENSAGKVLASGFASESGYTFTGLSPGTTYYVYPADCDLCHGSTHNVLFQHWDSGSSSVRPLAVVVGTSLDAWYSCTNGCAGP